MRHIIALVLLVAGVVVILLSCLGVLVAPGAFEKLHFAAPASSLGGLLVGAGLAVEAAAFTPAFKDVFTVIVLAVTGPVVTTATARAVRARDQRRDDQGRDDQGRDDQGRDDQGRDDQARDDQARDDQGRDDRRDDRRREPGSG